MARRMVRARRASPYQLYLLIAFVVLTVAFAVLFAWMYNLYSSLEANVFGLQRIERAKATETDLWRELFNKYPDAANLVDLLEQKEQRAEQYQIEVHRLLEQLVGDPYAGQSGADLRTTVSSKLEQTTDVLAETAKTLQSSYRAVGDAAGGEVRPTSATAAIQVLRGRVDALLLQIKQDSTAKDSLQQQINGLQEELAAAKQEHARQVAQLESQLQDEKTRLEAARDSAIRQSQEFNERVREFQDQIIVERRKWQEERKKLEQEILRIRNDMNKMAEVIATFRQPPTEPRIDARIVRVSDLAGTAYADLGKDDGVLLGMPFSIFSRGQLGVMDAEPKAQARVVRILDDACELRLFDEGAEPVIPGDLLFNPVYDRQRRLSFRLIGGMDVDGDGVDDTERLKALIQQFGGRIDGQLTVKTDFLVIGEEPEVQAAPGPDAGPMERQRYEEIRKAFLEYTEEKAKAQSFSIPILSMNRFLGLVGIAGRF